MAKFIQPTRLLPIETAIQTLVWKGAPADTSPEDLLVPTAWAHVAKALLPGSHIIVQPEGLAWEAELIVISSGGTFAKVRMIRLTELNGADKAQEGAIGVKWNGPKHRFVVFHTSDNSVIRTGFDDREAAETWAKAHQMAMAA